jgi:hypothetical protein
MNRICISLLLICLPFLARADAFRCKGVSGQAIISSIPCSDNYATTRVVNSENPNANSVQRAQADLERQKQWLMIREREQHDAGPRYVAAPPATTVSGDAYDPVTRDRIHACLMGITAIVGLSPSQEAQRKVACYRGTVGLNEECEGRIAATSRLESREEARYKTQCRNL